MGEQRYTIYKKPINVTIDEDLLEKIEAAAWNLGLNRSQYINMVLTRYFRKKGNKDGEEQNAAKHSS